jgi:lipid II:glycine glycyltransferase (peptidoglycan interpeptide bridge formation enzyme)
MKSKSAFIAMAYYKQQPVAGGILVANNSSIQYYLGASDNKMNRITNASSLLHYEIIKFAKEKGFESFDLGGTLVKPPDPSDSFYGVYMFKKEFGGKQYNYDCVSYSIRKYHYLFVWWLRKYGKNPVAVRIYNLLRRNK